MQCKFCDNDVPAKRERFGTCSPNCHKIEAKEKARQRYADAIRAGIEDDKVLTDVRRHGAGYVRSGLRGTRLAVTERIIYDALMSGRV